MSDSNRVRVRPALRRVAIIAFVILVPIAAHSLWDYVELRRLVREIENIKANGEPVSEPQNYSYTPPDPNGKPTASGYYLAAAMLALEANAYSGAAPIQEWLAGSAHDPKALQQFTLTLGGLVTGTQEATSLADKAAALPFAGFSGGTEFSYLAAGLDSLRSLITARTVYLGAAGNGEAAVESMLSSLKLRDAARKGRSLPYPEDRQVAAILSLSRPSAASLLRLNTALAGEDRPDERVERLLRERGRYIGMIWRRYYGSDPNAPRHYTLPMRSVTETTLRPWLTHRAVTTLRTWADLVRVAKVPWPGLADAGDEAIARYRADARERFNRTFGLLASSSWPLSAFRQAVDATPLIVDRGSLLAVAVERFERDRGKRPDSLNELVPQYLSAIPADPYTGAPLLYRHTADRYTIYSVGPDKKDDGGDLTSQFQADVARGQKFRRIRGADVGVSVLVRP